MGEIKFTNNMLMAGLFTICIIAFAIGFATDNDSAITLSSDSDFQATQSAIQSDLISFNSTIGDAGSSFNEDNAQASSDTSTSGGQFKNPQRVGYGTAVSTMKNSFNKIFGEEFAVLSLTLLSILAFMAIRYAYKTWFGKNPN